jgi:hypothetical protein
MDQYYHASRRQVILCGGAFRKNQEVLTFDASFESTCHIRTVSRNGYIQLSGAENRAQGLTASCLHGTFTYTSSHSANKIVTECARLFSFQYIDVPLIL